MVHLEMPQNINDMSLDELSRLRATWMKQVAPLLIDLVQRIYGKTEYHHVITPGGWNGYLATQDALMCQVIVTSTSYSLGQEAYEETIRIMIDYAGQHVVNVKAKGYSQGSGFDLTDFYYPDNNWFIRPYQGWETSLEQLLDEFRKADDAAAEKAEHEQRSALSKMLQTGQF